MTSEQEPQYGDYILTDYGNIGQYTTVYVHEVKVLGTYDSEQLAVKAIRKYARDNAWYQPIYRQLDHGGYIKTDYRIRRVWQ